MLRFESARQRYLPASPFAILGSLIGFLSFSGHWQSLAFAALLLVAIQFTKSRAQCFVLCLTYYLAATRGLPEGIIDFTGKGYATALLLWLCANAISATIHALFWVRNPTIRALLSILAVIVLALPPMGITGWANPVVASGVLYPALGFAGIIQFFGLVLSINLRLFPHAAVFGLLALGANLGNPKPAKPLWVAHSTEFGPPPSDQILEFKRQFSLSASLQRIRNQNILLPETAVTSWTTVTETFWAAKLPDNGAIAIGSVRDTGTKRQALIFLSRGRKAEYLQRQPVPLTMWRPWSQGGYESGWFDNPAVEFGGHKLGVFICYEAFLVWPILHSAIAGADQFLLSANLWWSRRTSIPSIQTSILHVWARLFHIPYAVAVNI